MKDLMVFQRTEMSFDIKEKLSIFSKNPLRILQTPYTTHPRMKPWLITVGIWGELVVNPGVYDDCLYCE
jgi:hypothetical protein